jgi:predicted AlkP superfamily phosphohydrolase/phosphomutase
MSARVLVIGFDACEASLVRRWADEGKLPNFAALARASRTFQLDNPMETLPGAIWPEINTGCSSGKMGHFYIPNQLHTGEPVMRAVEPDDIDPEFYYWTQASRAGRRVAVIDPVQAVAARGIDGVQLIEWGLHDRTFEISSEPPQLLEDIRAAYGDHPVRSCDLHGQTPEGYRRLLQGLLDGVRTKAKFSVDILAREAWDLFSVTYSESHCAGHQFWHFIDPRHPWHDPGAPGEFRHALLDVYKAIDDALPATLAAAGPEARVFAIFSHGIDLYYDGPQLLPEVLARLGLAGGGAGRAGRLARRVRTRVTYLPRPVKALIKRLARTRALAAPAAAAGCAVDPFASPKTRAAFVNNNRCGGIRLNLRGREPFGSVEPGPEATALLQMLRRELLALRDPASGEPIVVRVQTASELFGPDHHPNLPDLICVFRTDLGMLERCESPAVGRVYVPVYHPHAPRSGDHTVNSQLWASGPGVAGTPEIGRGNVLDLAPTILAALDVALPDWLDGRPLRVSAAAQAPRPAQDGVAPSALSAAD